MGMMMNGQSGMASPAPGMMISMDLRQRFPDCHNLPVVNAPRLHFTFLVACHTVWMFVSFITESWLCLVKVSTPFLSLTSSRHLHGRPVFQIDVLLLVLMSHHRSGLPACRQQSAESALSGMLS